MGQYWVSPFKKEIENYGEEEQLINGMHDISQTYKCYKTILFVDTQLWKSILLRTGSNLLLSFGK